jgi:hypothetical protein
MEMARLQQHLEFAAMLQQEIDSIHGVDMTGIDFQNSHLSHHLTMKLSVAMRCLIRESWETASLRHFG